MTSTVKLRAAEALFPLLTVFQEIDGARLDGVTQLGSDGAVLEIRLHVGSRFLGIKAVEEDDTIDLFLGGDQGVARGEAVDHLQPWSNLLGKQIGWGWVMVNQQGYLDGILLSFGGVVPDLLIAVVASSLQVRKCSQ